MQAGFGTGASEVGVLGQEAIARVDGVASGALRGVEQSDDGEIALGRACRADLVGFIGKPYVGRQAVGLRVNGHRRDAELATGAHDANGDLTAIGDQYFFRH